MIRERIAVQLLLFLNRLLPDFNAETTRSKHSLAAYSAFEYGRAASVPRLFGSHFDVTGKDVLDIGCGLGGSERYYLEQGARSVVAVDLEPPRLLAAQNYVRSAVAAEARGGGRFVALDARRAAFRDAAFDVIISTNTFEHIFGVEQTLHECARLLRSDGRLLISFPPYYAPWGAHLGNWIRVPWCQVLFSEKVLMEAARRIEDRLRLNAWMPEAIRLELSGNDRIPHLNRMGLQEFGGMVARSPLEIVQSDDRAIGWRSKRLLNNFGAILVRARPLREYVTSQAVYVLKKDGP